MALFKKVIDFYRDPEYFPEVRRIAVPIMLFVAVQFRKRILVEYRVTRRTNSKITGAFNENFQGVRVVKALLREDENTKEFQVLTSNMQRQCQKQLRLI